MPAYYLVRNTLALAIPDILKEHPEYSKAALGTALTGLSLAYGLSKFLMGSVSDRSNPRYFLPLGLLLSAGIIAACGLSKGIYASLTVLIVLQTLNGWVQGMGWPRVRQDDGALVQHQRARHGGVGVEHRAQRGRRAGGELRGARRHAVRRLGRQVLLQRGASRPASRCWLSS